MRVWHTIATLLGDGRACVLATVLDGKGSVPREDGARMIVLADGGFHGTIGGGALEYEAIHRARRMLSDGARAYVKQRLALGPELGQCCGGSATVSFEPFDATDLQAATALAEAERDTVLSTLGRLDAKGRIERRIVAEAASSKLAEWTNAGELAERFGETVRQIILFGAGHVGRALVLALAPLPFRVTWVDSRADAFPKYMPENVTALRLDNPIEALASLETGGFVLVMSHSHDIDREITGAALRQGRAAFVGLIGSKTKRTRFEKRFRQAGLSEEAIASLVCPIGLSGIRSKRPAAIAASTVAQLLELDEKLACRTLGETGKAAYAAV